MIFSPSPLYDGTIDDLEKEFSAAIDAGLTDGTGKAVVFFRADDIGVPSRMFTEMISLFYRYRVPLCLAVVPAWLTKDRLKALQNDTGNSSLFCWHQHGWTHTNHESSGKKQEFGESRSAIRLHHDLLRGKKRLANLLGHDFFPVFTPPWNRCGETTLHLLKELGFRAISRSSGAVPPVSTDFVDLQVNIDLHTRKEIDPQISAAQLLTELRHSIQSGTAGIMLHHQRMNTHALVVLEQLLRSLLLFQCIQPFHFSDMLNQPLR